jgi:hypothetical protein
MAGFGRFRAGRSAARQAWVILSRSNEGRIKVEGFGYRKKFKVGKRRVRKASCLSNPSLFSLQYPNSIGVGCWIKDN